MSNKPMSTHKIHIAYKGKVLKDDFATLLALDIAPNAHRPIPKLYVTMNTLQQSKPKPIARPHPPISTTPPPPPPEPSPITNTVPAAPAVPSSSDIVDLQYTNLTGTED